MKTPFLVSRLLFGLLGLFFLASCSNESAVNPSQTTIVNNLEKGSWRITYFNDSGKDETNHFTNYTLTFGNNGVLTATDGNASHLGTWSISVSNSIDDNPGDHDFNILFSVGNDFDDLTEDWHFISQTSIRIELIHISGGNGGTDYLTLEQL